MTILIEDQGQVSLYRNGSEVFFTNNGWRRSLQGLTWNFNSGNEVGWRVVAADFLKYPSHISSDYPYEDILVLWEKRGDWQAMTFDATNGFMTGVVSNVQEYWSAAEVEWLETQSSQGWYRAEKDTFYFSSDAYFSGYQNYMTPEVIDSRLGIMFQEVYFGAHILDKEYELSGIKDFDGFLHASPLGVADSVKSSYKYQGAIDVNGDGESEKIFTNKESGRWVTASINSSNGEINYGNYGSGGTTRVVGIYIDPLVTSGVVDQGGPHDSQTRFQNDLQIDNLSVRASNDYDSDGIQEVYWKTNDGTAYLRALMHNDGNIRYANYQSEDQMRDYLTINGHGSDINSIVS